MSQVDKQIYLESNIHLNMLKVVNMENGPNNQTILAEM